LVTTAQVGTIDASLPSIDKALTAQIRALYPSSCRPYLNPSGIGTGSAALSFADQLVKLNCRCSII
jgi:hypothetical protein